MIFKSPTGWLSFMLSQRVSRLQRAMDYAFHDIRNIVQYFLDDLPAHSKKRSQHLAYLREIFLRCRFYNICLNPHKCVLFVEYGCLLGFIVSKHGIRVDPDKVKSITQFPVPQSILQLQRLQGKGIFLCRFMVNYAELTKGFMHLLKKGVP